MKGPFTGTRTFNAASFKHSFTSLTGIAHRIDIYIKVTSTFFSDVAVQTVAKTIGCPRYAANNFTFHYLFTNVYLTLSTFGKVTWLILR